MESRKERNALDGFRWIAAILVICNHTSPLVLINPTADFILTRIIARVAVPFFFMLTGYFVLCRKEETAAQRSQRIHRWCLRLLKLYGITILIYIPINLYANQLSLDLMILLQEILINGTFYHLWYFPAVITGVFLMNEMMRITKPKVLLLITGVLYLIALGGDSYYGIVSQSSWIKESYDRLFLLFEYTRNGFLFAPLFLVMGATIANSRFTLKKQAAQLGTMIFLAGMIAEGLTLHQMNAQRHDSMYLMLVPLMFFLFQACLSTEGKVKPSWRKTTMLIYIIHPIMLLVVRTVGKIGTLKTILVDNNLVLFLLTTLLSISFSGFAVWVMEKAQPLKPSKKGRAWIEINHKNLRHNVFKLQSILPEETKIMAAIKANGYGHGSVELASELEKIGIDAFAVATVNEAIELRENCITSDILILGYTSPDDFACLTSYDLIQTIVDSSYAQQLNQFGKKIRVHVAIDTGMHRLGIGYDETEALQQVYQSKNLKVEGIFTHLCVADSPLEIDQEYTYMQIQRFDRVIAMLKQQGIDPKKTHVQGTYGVLNYPELRYDYARIGLALYGVLSEPQTKTKVKVELRPVMSLCSRIISLREIEANESVGYGRQFVTQRKTKIACLSIGFADGLPRLAQKEGLDVIIHGHKAKIIGRICMDLCMVDVTDLEDVQVNDIAILVGKDQDSSITPEQYSIQCNSITNETLSRFSTRLPRIGSN